MGYKRQFDKTNKTIKICKKTPESRCQKR